jgi:hypothetical protein
VKTFSVWRKSEWLKVQVKMRKTAANLGTKQEASMRGRGTERRLIEKGDIKSTSPIIPMTSSLINTTVSTEPQYREEGME